MSETLNTTLKMRDAIGLELYDKPRKKFLVMNEADGAIFTAVRIEDDQENNLGVLIVRPEESP